jgi:peptidoglycan hydrolase-like protein with peptidoglycan-binding domain
MTRIGNAPQPTRSDQAQPATAVASPSSSTTTVAPEGIDALSGPRALDMVDIKEKATTVALPTTADLAPLSQSDRGPMVTALQNELRSRGARLNPTGVFDQHTTLALTKIQKDLGLPATGKLDVATIALLKIPAGAALADAQTVAGERANHLADWADAAAESFSSLKKCATAVNHALNIAGFDVDAMASAYMYGDMLAERPDMREVIGLTENDISKLPPGAIVVYGKSEEHVHGHIAVIGKETTPDGLHALEASDHHQSASRMAHSRTYGRDFGHGQVDGPRFRVFMPVDTKEANVP